MKSWENDNVFIEYDNGKHIIDVADLKTLEVCTTINGSNEQILNAWESIQRVFDKDTTMDNVKKIIKDNDITLWSK